MKRNEGLSLIELIVVIAIMTVLISVVGISITAISRQKVSNAVEDVKVLFQTAQTIAMSKDNCHIEIDQDSDGETVFTLYSSTGNNVLNRITISKKVKVKIFYNGEEKPIETVKAVNIYYDRVSGAFSNMYKNGTSPIDGTGITGIEFSAGTNNSVTLKLTKMTGRVSY